MIGCPKNYVVGGAMLFGKASFEYQRATMPSKFVIRNSVNEKI
jgi:hypothetical protein